MSAEEQIMQILEEQLAITKEKAVNYHNNPYLPENVHQYRVHMRRLRSLLNFIKPIIDKNQYKEINELLKKQGEVLSPIRDLDVFIEKISMTAQDQHGLLDSYPDVFKFLHEKRLKVIDEYASKENIENSKDRMTQVEEKLDRLAFDSQDSEVFLVKKFDKDASKLEKEYDKVAESDYEHTHETRKLAKKVRYNADGYKKMLSKKKAKKISKKAKSIQTELGTVTDAHVHADLLKKYRDEVEGEKLKKAFETLLPYQSSQSEQL